MIDVNLGNFGSHYSFSHARVHGPTPLIWAGHFCTPARTPKHYLPVSFNYGDASGCKVYFHCQPAMQAGRYLDPGSKMMAMYFVQDIPTERYMQGLSVGFLSIFFPKLRLDLNTTGC